MVAHIQRADNLPMRLVRVTSDGNMNAIDFVTALCQTDRKKSADTLKTLVKSGRFSKLDLIRTDNKNMCGIDWELDEGGQVMGNPAETIASGTTHGVQGDPKTFSLSCACGLNWFSGQGTAAATSDAAEVAATAAGDPIKGNKKMSSSIAPLLDL